MCLCFEAFREERRCFAPRSTARFRPPPGGLFVRRGVVELVLEREDRVREAAAQGLLVSYLQGVVAHEDLQALDVGERLGEPDAAVRVQREFLKALEITDEGRKLEELDLGRTGLRSVPPQIASLGSLKKLGLDYNDLRELPAFVGNFKSLEELSLNSNGGVKLPQTLSNIKGLKVFMGNNALKLRDQQALRRRFPDIVFSFENEFDDAAANEEPAKPRRKTRR